MFGRIVTPGIDVINEPEKTGFCVTCANEKPLSTREKAAGHFSVWLTSRDPKVFLETLK